MEATFDSTSEGQLAMVIYEWRDMSYLGKITSYIDESLPVRHYAGMPCYTFYNDILS